MFLSKSIIYDKSTSLYKTACGHNQRMQAAHAAFLDDGALEAMAKPSRRGDRRLAGLDMNKARIRSVADAMLALCTRPDGLTASHHLVQHLLGVAA